jgi:hypothetical protein
LFSFRHSPKNWLANQPHENRVQKPGAHSSRRHLAGDFDSSHRAKNRDDGAIITLTLTHIGSTRIALRAGM